MSEIAEATKSRRDKIVGLCAMVAWCSIVTAMWWFWYWVPTWPSFSLALIGATVATVGTHGVLLYTAAAICGLVEAIGRRRAKRSEP